MKTLERVLLPLVLLSFCLATTPRAEAAARAYSNPKLRGQAVDACLADQTTCGKAAADAFCRLQGYRHALSFRMQQDLLQISTSVVIDSGRLLRGPEARPFQMVKCWRPNEQPSAVQFKVENITSPTLCDFGLDCRKSAADSWCEQKGFALGATAYELFSDRPIFRSITCGTL
jgi:hypothetical protein